MADDIIRYIIDNRVINTTQLSQWCLKNDCWSEFRRSYRIFYDIMFEVRNLPRDELPQSFKSNNQESNNNQVEMNIGSQHPNGFDPQLSK